MPESFEAKAEILDFVDPSAPCLQNSVFKSPAWLKLKGHAVLYESLCAGWPAPSELDVKAVAHLVKTFLDTEDDWADKVGPAGLLALVDAAECGVNSLVTAGTQASGWWTLDLGQKKAVVRPWFLAARTKFNEEIKTFERLKRSQSSLSFNVTCGNSTMDRILYKTVDVCLFHARTDKSGDPLKVKSL